MNELTFFTLFIYGLCGLCGLVSMWCVGWGLVHLFGDPAVTGDPGDNAGAIQKFMRDYRMFDDGDIERNLENMQTILNGAYDIFHDMGHREENRDGF